mgnify:FL=1
MKLANPLKALAERMRFELTKGLPPYALSRGAPWNPERRFSGLQTPVFVTSRHASTQPITGTPEHSRWNPSRVVLP